MINAYINYTLIQDGVKSENSLTGKFEKVNNLYRVTFEIDSDGVKTNHSYVKLSNNSFKISVKGDSEYSLRVQEGESGMATLKSSQIEMPFTTYTKVCEVTADESGMKFYAEYDITIYNQIVKNKLMLVVSKIGDLKC